MARGIYSEEFKNKGKITIYLPMWMIRKLKYVGNQSRKIEKDILDSNPDWLPPGPKTEDKKKK